ncbi:hypothetical protein LIR45_11275, partial [Lachnospiraceae bacterium EP-SM-12S-S03]|nr:hypothetical protein [Lachnospiraceae bacterium EP-SM-12S-S03]
GSLAITVTGLAPASVIQLRWTHIIKKEQEQSILRCITHAPNQLFLFFFYRIHQFPAHPFAGLFHHILTFLLSAPVSS